MNANQTQRSDRHDCRRLRPRLVQYGIRKELIKLCNSNYTINRLQHVLGLDQIDQAESHCIPLEEIL